MNNKLLLCAVDDARPFGVQRRQPLELFHTISDVGSAEDAHARICEPGTPRHLFRVWHALGNRFRLQPTYPELVRVNDQPLEDPAVLVDIDLGDRITLPSLGVEYRADLAEMTPDEEVRCGTAQERMTEVVLLADRRPDVALALLADALRRHHERLGPRIATSLMLRQFAWPILDPSACMDDDPLDLPRGTTQRTDEGTPLASHDFDSLLRVRVARQGRRYSYQGPIDAAALSPDGQLIAVVQANGDVQLWDATRLWPVGVPIRVRTTPGPSSDRAAIKVAFSKDSQHLFIREDSHRLTSVPLLIPGVDEVDGLIATCDLLAGLQINSARKWKKELKANRTERLDSLRELSLQRQDDEPSAFPLLLRSVLEVRPSGVLLH